MKNIEQFRAVIDKSGKRTTIYTGSYRECNAAFVDYYNVHKGEGYMEGLVPLNSNFPELTKEDSERIDREIYIAVTETRAQTRASMRLMLKKSLEKNC